MVPSGQQHPEVARGVSDLEPAVAQPPEGREAFFVGGHEVCEVEHLHPGLGGLLQLRDLFGTEPPLETKGSWLIGRDGRDSQCQGSRGAPSSQVVARMRPADSDRGERPTAVGGVRVGWIEQSLTGSVRDHGR